VDEFRCFGPPGTGKTTWLARQIRHAKDRYFGSEIVVCSFTRAAAVEIASRETGIPKQNVGTIHSLCFRAMDAPTIIETDRDLLGEWNRKFGHIWPVHAGKFNLDEPASGESDALMTWNR